MFLGVAQTLLITYFPSAARRFPPAYSYSEWNYQQFGLLRPWRQDWKLAEISNCLERVKPGMIKKVVFIKTRDVVVAGLLDLRYFEICLSNFNLCSIKEMKEASFLFSELNKADIVIRTINGYTNICENENRLEKIFVENIGKFTLLDIIILPDGTQLEVYKSNKIFF